MATLSTHVLDTMRGAPADTLAVTLYRCDGRERTALARAATDRDGRVVKPFGGELAAGTYELAFSAGPYFARSSTATFYDEISVRFNVDSSAAHVHVPLLLSPYAYSTYRGS